MTTAPTETHLPAAGTWMLDPSHSTVGFMAKHLMVFKVRGTFDTVEGTVVIGERPEDSSVDVAIQVESVHTGVPDRDGHLRSPDFFDVDNYPVMRFVSTSVEPAGDRWRLNGDLTIKDVTRPVTLDLAFEGMATDPWGKDHAAFSARTEVDREDWGLIWNVALEAGGWLVSRNATIEIETELIPAS